MRKRGFTIVELSVAIVIIMVLTVLSVLYLTKARAQAKLSRLTGDLSSVATAVTQYAEDHGYQYPADVNRSVPPGLERYLQNGVWPEGPWPNGVFDWDNWIHPTSSKQIYQITYRLCGISDPLSSCSDPILFPNFERNSGIFYCISGPCIPHNSTPAVPGYAVNAKPKEQNYGANASQNGAGVGWNGQ